LGNSGTGTPQVALALGLVAGQRGFTVAFTLPPRFSQMLEARRAADSNSADFAAVKLLIVDELGYVPLSSTGAELLFEVFSQRYERGSANVTFNLPFKDWTPLLGSERLTGALLDRLTHSPRQHPDHERRQLSPEAVYKQPPLGRRRQGGAKAGHCRDHRPQHGRNHHQLTIENVAAHRRHWPRFTLPHWPKIGPR
jgi:hypothetical protein